MNPTGTIPRRWSVADSREIYAVRQWGGRYFDINEAGHVVVHPAGPAPDGSGTMDLKELVDEVRQRGIGLPLLIRFPEILKARIVELNEAFRTAITEYGYKGTYRGVYPIKVNQDRYVVEQIATYGRPYHYGLEAGSKPELLAVIALLEDEEALIICNGYKDEEYVESALLASKLGRNLILVVEKFSELPLIAAISRRTGVRPRIGIRAKLSARGSGRWESSGGDRSKFGLSAREMLEAMKFLRENGLLDSFELLHFHLGSQISSIRAIKNAMREASRFFVDLWKAGAPLHYLDVGGGLGVDYDGSQTNFSSSMNYSMQEYANDIVFGIMELCDEAGVPHPDIISESGRAVVAHHAILVVDVLGVSEFAVGNVPEQLPSDAAPVVRHLWETYRDVTRKNLLEAYHDAIEYKEECLTLFQVGHLSLEQRVAAEDIFWAICQKVLRMTREMPHVPEDLQGLRRALSDTYFCNFSMFQSVPDSWAVDQLFPIMPIHRLGEEPTRCGVLADITCDSDGKIDQFIDPRDVKDVLELHPLTGEDYYIGIFMVGAYQEILGDLHNLFGDTNTVHVVTAPGGGYHIEHVIIGDTVTDVLQYVGHSRDDLTARMRRAAEVALRNRRMTLEETRTLLRIYEQGLSGYTYLERD
ncbi:MAG: biosynthetic arginine decarboxylase [Myxococcales bacterium]|nr:biosynthetic arginine decarboxylase [Myxococcota bacterium]MDW8280619.1 biosynthetic arginine decarboxylase [Myxococcales bacterium]